MRWTVVIPAKALPAAKSRLLPASVDVDAHRRLVEAIRADTVEAAGRALGVARVVIITDRADTATPGVDVVLVQTSDGLNAALSEAAGHAADHWPDDGVAALVGDLPALQAGELADALAGAANHPRAHVPDAAGTGTTLLTARAGTRLEPAFGEGSAARHAVEAPALVAGPGLRTDVDTADDLRAAVDLGVGEATRAALARSPIVQLKAG